MRKPSFHNTLDLSGRDLAKAEAAATKQEEKVLLFFIARKWGAFPPSRVHKMMIKDGTIAATTPLTSIRRAITNLTKDDKLVQTERCVDGPMGKPEHTWRVNLTKKIRNLPVQKTLFE